MQPRVLICLDCVGSTDERRSSPSTAKVFSINDGLQPDGDVEQFFLVGPCFDGQQVFDLLFFQVGKVGFDKGAGFRLLSL